jgi:hypothetical protein
LLALFAIPLNVVTFALWIGVIRAKRDPSRLAPPAECGFSNSRVKRGCGWPSSLRGGRFFWLAATAFAAAMLMVCAWVCAEPALDVRRLLMGRGGGCGGLLWTAQETLPAARFAHPKASQTLVLPPAGGRKEPLLVPRGEIVAVSMHRRVSHSPSGQYFSYVPALDRAAPTPNRSRSIGQLGLDGGKSPRLCRLASASNWVFRFKGKKTKEQLMRKPLHGFWERRPLLALSWLCSD